MTLPARRFALGRHRRQPGTMNQTEARYAQYLELRKKAGEILDYAYEGMKLRLADGAYFKPDFYVLLADLTIQIVEVKGHWEEAARVRIKVAADRWPFHFIAVTAERGGGWRIEDFS